MAARHPDEDPALVGSAKAAALAQVWCKSTGEYARSVSSLLALIKRRIGLFKGDDAKPFVDLEAVRSTDVLEELANATWSLWKAAEFSKEEGNSRQDFKPESFQRLHQAIRKVRIDGINDQLILEMYKAVTELRAISNEVNRASVRKQMDAASDSALLSETEKAEIENHLSGQPLNIFRFLAVSKGNGWTHYETLKTQRLFWRGSPDASDIPDETVHEALRRLRNGLSSLDSPASLRIENSSQRTRLHRD